MKKLIALTAVWIVVSFLNMATISNLIKTNDRLLEMVLSLKLRVENLETSTPYEAAPNGNIVVAPEGK